MNLTELNRNLQAYTQGKLEIITNQLSKDLKQIEKKLEKLSNENYALEEKIVNADSRAEDRVREKLPKKDKPGNNSFFIIVIAVAVLIFINVSLDVPEGFQAIIFFGGLAPVALIFHKLFFSSREDKGHLEYENYEKEWEKLLKKEKSRSGSTKIKNKIKKNKILINSLDNKESKISSILNKIPFAMKRSRERERTAKIAAYDNRARIGSETVRNDLLRTTRKNNWKCPYCNEKKNIKYSQADHIHPITKGGLTTIQNMILVCKLCNSLKKGSTLRVFCKKFQFNFNEVCDRLEKQGKDI
jgi:5-methylcytosine-specific restriction endonuclease McrA